MTTMTLYRGEYNGHSPRRLNIGDTFDAGEMVWLTADPQGALGYLRGKAGYLYTATVTGNIAIEEVLIDIAASLGYDTDEYDVHELVEDCEGVIERLQWHGYTGVEYGETCPRGYPIYTVAIFDGSAATVTAVESV